MPTDRFSGSSLRRLSAFFRPSGARSALADAGLARVAVLVAVLVTVPITVPVPGTLLGPDTLHAQDRTLSIDRFDVDVWVGEDATIDVVERIRFRFDGSWNGIYRDIPVEYRTPAGLEKHFDLDVDYVRDESGQDLRYETSRERHYRRVKAWVPGATNTSRTVVIGYRVENALLFFDAGDEGFEKGHDELYWNVTGDEWEMPIRASSARVHLPEGVTGTRAIVYTGPFGSREQAATVEETEDGFYFEATRGFAPHEGLTVAVQWDPGVVERPTVVESAGRVIGANWVLLIPFLAFFGMWKLWDARGRDPARRPITVQYEPPEGLSPAEAGALMDHRVDPHDVTSILVDLAVRGYLRIEEVERSGLIEFFGGKEYRLVRTRDGATWQELEPFEREVLAGIFGAGGYEDEVDLSDLKNEFYTHLPKIREEIYDRLVELGHYTRRPDKVWRTYLIGAAVIGFLSIWGVGMLTPILGISAVALAIAGVATAVVVGIFGAVMPARTVSGTRTLEHVLGFEEYMNRVEEDHLKRTVTSPELFEKYLPYAMAMQVEERWARAFEGILKQPPDWYVGTGHGTFRATDFTSRLSAMTTSASSTMSSSPRSSGGSGFSGGGGSGGGGGGGGGGGF